jgi:hypothetical protein
MPVYVHMHICAHMAAHVYSGAHIVWAPKPGAAL